MRCHEVKSWTFPGIVAAFLDLSVAFSLLSASSLIYITSKLLGLFGLNLPCPCDGMFSDPHKNKCFQQTLVNLPMEKISSVQRSVRNKTPFDSANDGGGKKRKGDVEFEKEVFITPSVKEVEKASCFDLLTSQSLKKGSFRVKSKRLSFHKSSSPYGQSKNSPASVLDCLNDPLLANSKDCGKALEDVSLRKSVSLCSIGCEDGAHNKQLERTISWVGEGNENLEQLLAEERASRAALALELEKERNAAATAADEALGMILRLQEEKASIEMEARQYQRMIEEKSAFDAEELSILKDILLRREREKHFLEKEVDTYRQMFLDTEPPGTEGSQTPQQTTDSFGFEIFPNQMDNRILDYDNENDEETKVNGVDQDPEIVTEQQEIEFKKVDCCVHDIYVVKDEVNKVQLNVPSERDLKLNRSQSVLVTSYGLPPACPQGQKIMSPTMRRNSMSALDYERLKIESEVGLLRGRLRAVQKSREKISFGAKTTRFWEARRSEPIISSSLSSTMVKAMSMSLDLHSA